MTQNIHIHKDFIPKSQITNTSSVHDINHEKLSTNFFEFFKFT